MHSQQLEVGESKECEVGWQEVRPGGAMQLKRMFKGSRKIVP